MAAIKPHVRNIVESKFVIKIAYFTHLENSTSHHDVKLIYLLLKHFFMLSSTELLILLRETQTDELADTISKMVENFGEDMSSIAFELTSTLVSLLFIFPIFN